MNELPELCVVGSSELVPAFTNALVRLACLLESLERVLSGDHEPAPDWREHTFVILDSLYGELRTATQHLDENAALAGVKARHIGAFRSLVGRYLWQAPFFRHSCEKPRGYAGDFEMMEMLYDSRVDGSTAFSRLIQEHFMRGAGPRSVRSRREYLQALLAAQVEDGRARRVLSVASGSAREVRELFRASPDANLEIVLLDRDRAALDFAMNGLREAGVPPGRVRMLRASIKDVAQGALTSEEPFDLIYSTGLYDYLPQDVAISLTRRLAERLVPGGSLVIANYAREHVNPDRLVVEYAQDWFLVTRDELEMRGLVESLNVEMVRVGQDAATGSIHFLSACRPAT